MSNLRAYNTADWTVLDARQDQPSWDSVFNNSECRLMMFGNATAYRYYRFKATAAQSGSLVEIVQLEYFNYSCGLMILVR